MIEWRQGTRAEFTDGYLGTKRLYEITQTFGLAEYCVWVRGVEKAGPVFDTLGEAKHFCEMHHATGA